MKKKILFIINVDWYFKLHWMERAEFLRDCGYSISLMTNFSSEESKQSLMNIGISCHDMSLKRKSVNLFHDIITLITISKTISQVRPDMIHCITIKPNIYGGLINTISYKLPIIYSITGLGAVFSSRKGLFPLVKRFVINIYRFISNNKSCFVFENSDDYSLFFRENIIKNNNGVVIKGAGIDLNRFLPSEPPLQRRVLFAARLLKDKGLHHLVAAKRALEARGIVFTLQVAGIIDKDVRSAIPLSEIEHWNQKGDIEWLGNVQDMPSLIKNCDIVCLPTTYGEGVPRILIEAASCQRAIITTNVSGCREIVEHDKTGLLAEPGSVDSLANCLEFLLSDNERIVSFGTDGRIKVEKEFSQEIVFEKTLQIYQSLLGE